MTEEFSASNQKFERRKKLAAAGQRLPTEGELLRGMVFFRESLSEDIGEFADRLARRLRKHLAPDLAPLIGCLEELTVAQNKEGVAAVEDAFDALEADPPFGIEGKRLRCLVYRAHYGDPHAAAALSGEIAMIALNDLQESKDFRLIWSSLAWLALSRDLARLQKIGVTRSRRIFLAVLEEGSLAGAARKLGLSHPTVRSRIETLEQTLGTVLFTRSVNGLRPTEAAEALLEPARAMAMASERFVRQASASGAEIAGWVRISVPEVMGIEVVPAMLARLREKHPAIRVELSLSNLPADLLAQEVDLAVRTVSPKQGALFARKVATIPLGLFASPAYVERCGLPSGANDLARHAFLGPDRNPSDLAFAERMGLRRAQLVLRTDSHPAQLAAARAGLGIAVAQVPVGEHDARLVRLLPDFEVAILETWIVTHENLARVPRVRAAFDSFVESFRIMGS